MNIGKREEELRYDVMYAEQTLYAYENEISKIEIDIKRREEYLEYLRGLAPKYRDALRKAKSELESHWEANK